MQRADDGLVLRDRFAVGAVAEHVAQRPVARLALRGEAERGQRVVQRVGDPRPRGRARSRARSRARPPRRRPRPPVAPDRPREPLGELPVGLRAAARPGAPRGATAHSWRGRPAGLRARRGVRAARRRQSRCELDAHRVGMAADAARPAPAWSPGGAARASAWNRRARIGWARTSSSGAGGMSIGTRLHARRVRDLFTDQGKRPRGSGRMPAEHALERPRGEERRWTVSERRQLLVSKAWIQAVLLVVLVGFFILGLLAYRTYMAHPPVPERVVDQQGRVLYTGHDISKGQQVFLHNGLMEYGSAFGHGAYLGPGLHGRLPAPRVGPRQALLRRRRVGLAPRAGRSRTSAPTATTSARRRSRFSAPQAQAFRALVGLLQRASSPIPRPGTACGPTRSPTARSCAS